MITRLSNSGAISGGSGGAFAGASGVGGAGGAGVSNAGTIATLTNSGKIAGGNGAPALPSPAASASSWAARAATACRTPGRSRR